MLHADTDTSLSGFLSELQGLLHQRGETLAARVAQPGRGGVAEVADFLLLQTVNRYEPLIAHFAAHSLLHPERLFSMCWPRWRSGNVHNGLIAARRYPEYQHDALAVCFIPLIADLRQSLEYVLDTNTRFSFNRAAGSQYGVRVAAIPDRELLEKAHFILAVSAQLPTEALRSIIFPRK